MGHDAFILAEVVSGIDEKLTCLTYNGDDLYVGTATGKLLVFRVRSTPTSSGKVEYSSTRLQSVDASATRAPITQVDAVPDLNLLITVSDGGLSLWDLDTMRKRSSGVLDTKAVLFFALNVRGPPRYKLCVVSAKKRLRLYSWDASLKSFVFAKDLDLPDVPRAVVYYGNRIACGYQREYNVLLEDTGEVRDATGVMARDTRPLIKHLPPVVVRRADGESTGNGESGGQMTTSTGATDNLLIITADDVGVVLNANGEPATVPAGRGGAVAIPALQFGHHPLSLAYCYPYVISVGDNSTKIEVHATRGRRDEVVQRLEYPSGGGPAVALCDGRVGASSRSGLDFADAAKGRNPVFIAFSSPGRVLRLQPVPVDSQVEDMLRQGAVAAAQELLLNTAPESVLRAKLDRFNLDAGRVLFLSLHFAAAFAHLSASELDPRELIAMMPELQMSAAGVSAALAADPPEGAPSILTLARAYRYPSRYFSPSLTNAVVEKQKAPADAASEAADAPPPSPASYWGAAVESIAAAAAATTSLAGPQRQQAQAAQQQQQSALDSSGVRSGVAEATAIIAAGAPAYLRGRAAAATASSGHGHPRRGAAASASDSSGAAAAVAVERAASLTAHMLGFLRQRRREVARYIAGRGAAAVAQQEEGGADGGDTPVAAAYNPGARRGGGATAAAAGDGSSSLLATLVHSTPSGKRFFSTSSAFPGTLPSLPDAELEALQLAIDTALMKCLACTGRWAAVEKMLAKPSAVDLTDAGAFLRSRSRFHALGVLLTTRGLGLAALSLWRDLGNGVLVEATATGGDAAQQQQRRRGGAKPGGGGGDSFDSDGSASDDEEEIALRARLRHRFDSLSDTEEADGDATIPASAAEGVPRGRSSSSLDGGTSSSAQHARWLGTPGAAARAGPDSRATADTDFYATAAASRRRAGSTTALHRTAAAADGVAETVAFLQAESDASLVFTFAEWLLLRAPVLGLRVFTHSSRYPPLSPESVLRYLAQPQFAAAAARNPSSGVLRLYLEFLVFREGRADETFHTSLAREYVATVLRLREESSSSGGGGDTSKPGGSSSSATAGSRRLDAEARLGGPARDRLPPGTEGGTLGEMRTKLLRLLQESSCYDAGALSLLLRDTSLYEERVLLCARSGDHASALNLLVYNLADHARAVRYAELLHGAAAAAAAGRGGGASGASSVGGGGSSSSSGLDYDEEEEGEEGGGGRGSDPFLLLLRLYLNADRAERLRQAQTRARIAPASSSSSSSTSAAPVYTVYLDRALDLLSTHAAKINPLAVAKLLPSDLPLSRVAVYWDRAIPSSAHALRELAVAKHMFNFTYISTHAGLVEQQVQPTVVNRESACAVCEKRIGDSVFAVLPSGDLAAGRFSSAAQQHQQASPRRFVHFHCLAAAGCGAAPPSTGYGAQLLGLTSASAAMVAASASAQSGDRDVALAAAYGVLNVFTSVDPVAAAASSAASAAADSNAAPSSSSSFSYAMAKGWVTPPRPGGVPTSANGNNSSSGSSSDALPGSSSGTSTLPLALLMPHTEGTVADARQYMRTATVASHRHGHGHHTALSAGLIGQSGLTAIPRAAVTAGVTGVIGAVSAVGAGVTGVIGAVSAVERTVGSALHTGSRIALQGASTAAGVVGGIAMHGVNTVVSGAGAGGGGGRARGPSDAADRRHHGRVTFDPSSAAASLKPPLAEAHLDLSSVIMNDGYYGSSSSSSSSSSTGVGDGAEAGGGLRRAKLPPRVVGGPAGGQQGSGGGGSAPERRNSGSAASGGNPFR